MLGKTIARLRKAKGLTQAKFADMIHVTQGAISQWETGRTSPDVQQMFILAEFFGITVEELSTGIIPQEQASAPIQAQEKAPSTFGDQIMKELEGMTREQCREVLNFIRFSKARRDEK